MADSVAATGLTPQQWDDRFFTEYLRNHPFRAYMGTDENAIVQVKEDLAKKRGDSVTFALVNKLSGAGVTGSAALAGNEEAMDSRSFRLAVDQRRHAVRVSVMEEQKSAISLRDAARAVLKDWTYEQDVERIILGLGAINGVAYGAASEAQKDGWLADNADRVLFGAARSNNAANDHSASLLNVDAANDKLTASALSLLKRLALSASPRIRPIRVAGLNRRYFVAFVSARAMRDLKADTVLTQAQREVVITAQNEKFFQGGDVDWDGILVHEVDGIASLGAVGAAGAAVDPVYLCGAQALGHAICQRWNTMTEAFDYGDKDGIAIRTIDGLKKMIFGAGAGDTDDTKDHGVVTGYFAAAAD